MKLSSSILVVVLLLSFVPAAAEERRASALTLDDLKPTEMAGKRIGYLKKKLIGGPFQVIEEALIEDYDRQGDLIVDGDKRTFVVLGPDGYSWHFSYKRSEGVPEYEYVHGATPKSDYIVVSAPTGRAFAPVFDISRNNGLHCTNVGTCGVCNCCILCYCGVGSWCDSDDTGFYNIFSQVQEQQVVQLY